MLKLKNCIISIIFIISAILAIQKTVLADEISVKIDYCPDEIFPVYCALGPKIMEDGEGLFALILENNKNIPVTIKATCQVLDFSQPEIKTLQLNPGQPTKISFFPAFNNNVFNNPEQTRSSVLFKIEETGNVIFEQTMEVTMLATDDMIWGIEDDFDTAYLLAAWVTPRDPVISKVITSAKELVPDRSFCGYQRDNEEDFLSEVEAIWNTLQNMGISYVSSSVSFAAGYTQKIRLPRESIEDKSANCVDGSVLLASLFESIEMEPIIVVTEDHAYMGIKSNPESNDVYYLETTMIGNSTLEDAINEGENEFNELKGKKEGIDYVILDIADLRASGITPISVK